MGRIYIVGVGPGDPSYLTLKGLEIIEGAKVVSGWESVLSRFTKYFHSKEIVPLRYENEVEEIKRLTGLSKHFDVAILDHGDPSVSDFQFIRKIRAAANEVGTEVQVVSGVSSLLTSLALVQEDMANVVFVTLHVRGDESELLSQLDSAWCLGRSLMVIPPPRRDGVRSVARRLVELGHKGDVYVLEKVTYPDQRIVKTTAEALIQTGESFSDLVIMFVRR
ncbi:cobalt-precorrin-7 (C(5))-methyltransferase [Sulfodiicoccus acidiphilus]|nr:precorrin-6y C5,15-methyltransferase (decarboxylating) subunit CbiE [Sulfodiicoccus acidiphilus]GGT97138.1 cobalt-precorrin-7 (C(5))-methyltransferase [Sulfodiicoccus acidiphilus]